jgi:integrase
LQAEKLLSINATFRIILELLAHSWHTQMATIRKKGKLQWHVQIRRQGYKPVTKTFPGEKEAQEFARQVESDMDKGVYQEKSASASTTIETLAKKYIKDISPSKKNNVEDTRLMNVVIDKFGKYYLSNLKPLMVKMWLDELKNKGLSGSTINHHLSTLSSLIDTAIKEWSYSLPDNPCKHVKRMPSGKARDRRLLEGEEKLILDECALSRNVWLSPTVKLSILTGMRQGEIFSLEWNHVDLENQVAHLFDTKNGEDRIVPLSTKAVSVFNETPGLREGKVFKCSQHGVASSLRNALERAKGKYLEKCKSLAVEPQKGFLDNLRLHDLRHEATSRFFEKDLNVMEVASITGHKTLSMLKRYTHLKATNLAKKLG